MSSDRPKDQDIPAELLTYSKSLFDRYAADFDHLDNKALGIMGIVGLLISFHAMSVENIVHIFRSAAKGELRCLGCTTILFLVVHSLLLIFSIYHALRAFQVRSIEYPADTMELVEKFRTEKSTNRLKVDIVKTYTNSINNLSTANATKAHHLKGAVLGIFIALILLACFLSLLLIHKSFS